MKRLALLFCLAAAWGCSDDDTPPDYSDGPLADTIGDLTHLDQGLPWDGFDPRCPMPGPCVLSKVGQGKHLYLVIGEVLTLTGKELDSVTAVHVGAIEAPLITVSATKVTCRIGRRTPPGQHTVEIKASDKRRMAGMVDVRRLVAVAAVDDSKLTTFEAATHSAGPVLDLGFTPTSRPTSSYTGRYVVAAGAGKLALVDLALEQVASVSGLSGEAASWSVDDTDRTLLVATSSGKLLEVDLSGWPTLTAQAVSGAPGAALVALAAPGLFVGLDPDAATGEGSLWQVKTDLKSFGWVQLSGKPFLVGGGKGLTGTRIEVEDGRVAMLVRDGATVRLALVEVDSGALKSPVAPAVAGGLEVHVISGGTYLALSSDETKPTLPYLAAATLTSAKSLVLGGGGASRILARRLPTMANLALALVGPLPGSTQFKGGTLELADLAQGKRLTLTGDRPALELTEMIDAAGDPTADVVHLITTTHFHSYVVSLSGATLAVTEQHPHQLLPTGKTPGWIVVQP